MNEISAEDMIDEAISILQDDGWIRGQASSPEGYCVMGVLAEARKRLAGVRARHKKYASFSSLVRWNRATHAYAEAMKRVHHQINDGRKSLSIPIPDWNDHYARDADEVIETLKLAKEQQL